jgi:hypothetical protein
VAAVYPADVRELLASPRLQPLDAGSPNRAAHAALARLRAEDVVAGALVDREAALGCLAGLWLYHDFLDESHAISQELETAEGSYWHALMHRREPDFGNSKYWLRRVGRHVVFTELGAQAAELARQEGDLAREARFLLRGSEWDSFAFVDLCEAAHAGRSSCAMLCRRVQDAEWRLLFAWCQRRARGERGVS